MIILNNKLERKNLIELVFTKIYLKIGRNDSKIDLYIYQKQSITAKISHFEFKMKKFKS